MRGKYRGAALGILLCAALFTACAEEPRQLLEEIRSECGAQDWEGALELARQLMRDYPRTDEAEAASALAADCRARLNRSAAEQALAELNEAAEQGDWRRANALIRRVCDLAPDTGLAEQAANWIGQMETIRAQEECAMLSAALQEAELAGDWTKVLSTARTLLERYPDAEAAEQAQRYLELAEAKIEAREFQRAREILEVQSITCTGAGSYDVRVFLNFTNQSEKEIETLYCDIEFYNSLGNVVPGDPGGELVTSCKTTGPYAKGEGQSGSDWYWGGFTNLEIRGVGLKRISIVYMDGSSLTLTENQLRYVQQNELF